MEQTFYSKSLCNYIISKQQEDLLVIFDNFADKIHDPEDNTFFMQNEILDKMLTNLSKIKRRSVTLQSLHKGISDFEKKIIKPLDIEGQIIHNYKHSEVLGVDYLDEKKFLDVLDSALEDITTKYNLNAKDDYNKLYMFISSLQMSLQISDDISHSLINLYAFFHEHSNYSINELEDEYITIYGEKIYKIDILNKIIEDYKAAISGAKQEVINVNARI